MKSLTLKSRLFQIFEPLICLSAAIKTINRNVKRIKLEPECALLNRFVKQGDVCFDVGAGYGRIAYVLSKLIGPSGRVYCFEPGRFSFRVLSIVKGVQRLRNLIMMKLALSDKEFVSQMIIPVKDGNKKPGPSLAYLNLVVRMPEAYIIQDNVACLSLDEFVTRKGISRLDFLKCDVEGAELLFLKGARSTLRVLKPVLLMEVDPKLLARFGVGGGDVFQFLKETGYSAFLADGQSLRRVDSCRENEVNYFFFPADSNALSARADTKTGFTNL